MRNLGLVFLVIVGQLLSGCTTKNPNVLTGSAPRTLALNAADSKGILIIGVPSPWGRSVHGLDFHSYDPTSKRLISPAKGGELFTLGPGGRLFSLVDEAQGVRYIFQPLPAGHYFLTTTYWGVNSMPSLMAEGSIAVEVVAGTATYVGNVRFRVPFWIFGDVEIRLDGRNDAAARGILAKYPRIKARLRTARLRLFRLDCALDDGVKACYAP